VRPQISNHVVAMPREARREPQNQSFAAAFAIARTARGVSYFSLSIVSI
jgi:aromatic ring hydroxylase